MMSLDGDRPRSRKSFEVVEVIEATVRTVSITGELGLETAARIFAPLDDAARDRERPLVIDLTDCVFIDSAGLTALLHGAKPMQNGRSNVAVVCPDNEIRELLRLAAIDQTLPVFASRDEAITAVVPPS
jgi:anti-sigma B factor antagonist